MSEIECQFPLRETAVETVFICNYTIMKIPVQIGMNTVVSQITLKYLRSMEAALRRYSDTECRTLDYSESDSDNADQCSC